MGGKKGLEVSREFPWCCWELGRMAEPSLSSAGRSLPIPVLAQPCCFLPVAPGCWQWSSSGLGCTGAFGAPCKVFPCSKADPCCRHSPIFLQKVPRLLRRAAALAEPLPSGWCHMSLKRRQGKGQMSAKSLISRCPERFISSLMLVKAGTLLASSAAV